MLLSYLTYLIKARNEHGIHPPFLYRLYTEIIKKDYFFPVFKEIEQLRNSLLDNHNILEITDLGAGTKSGNQKERKISQIARTSLSPARYSQLQYRLIAHFKPVHIFELGTSLGINTMYLASANPKAKVYTLEGCPAIAKLAQHNFSASLLTNIELITGSFNTTFSDKLKNIGTIDYLFVDGNHRYEPTLSYFREALPYVHENTIIVFDDIYWSDEMMKAWKEIKKHPEVSLSLDFFKMGIILFDKKLSKQDFILRYLVSFNRLIIDFLINNNIFVPYIL